MKKRLAAIIGDKSVSKKVEGQQRQIVDLERRVEELRQELGSAKTSRAKSIRKEQNVVLGQIDELSKLKIEIMQKIKITSSNVLRLVERGMTPKEVFALLGRRRAGDSGHYNYGDYWVHFENGLVACIVKAANYKYRYCRNYVQNEVVK